MNPIILQNQNTYFTADEVGALLFAKDAEIEQIKEAYDIVQDHLVKAEQRLREKDKLISELCDALEWYVPLSLIPRDQDLLQHARDATK
jgi:hypothetical protein